MKTCPKCGAEVMEGFDSCFSCGEILDKKKTPVQANSVNYAHTPDASLLFLMIAFFFPLLGVVLYFGLRDRNQGLAKQILLATYLSFGLYAFMIAFFSLLVIAV